LTEEKQKRLNLVRYGGVVITVVVFVVLLVFSLLPISAPSTNSAGAVTMVSVNLIGSTLPYIIGFTILAAVLSVAVYFGYRQMLMGSTTVTTR